MAAIYNHVTPFLSLLTERNGINNIVNVVPSTSPRDEYLNLLV